jgi:glucose-1-phosphate thymidylyltransferase
MPGHKGKFEDCDNDITEVHGADSLYEAAGAIRAAQRSGNMIGCLEEIALRKGWINEESFRELADSMNKTNYGQYLGALAEEF